MRKFYQIYIAIGAPRHHLSIVRITKCQYVTVNSIHRRTSVLQLVATVIRPSTGIIPAYSKHNPDATPRQRIGKNGNFAGKHNIGSTIGRLYIKIPYPVVRLP